ncbi:hypothetical protein GBAR_LOCUS22771, partial [Geodia barretti]
QLLCQGSQVVKPFSEDYRGRYKVWLRRGLDKKGD